jgi:CubicO group peptidase (beta-lactamase class C family)
MLRQTSDWQGTLWGKPDWADRPAPDLEKERARERLTPGSVYEYNDTRVNLLALAALNVWRRPLPHVLREHVMDPIGASATWRWHGYDNSWVLLDGTAVQSVSGGSHWGGGMFINAYDQARFGLLTLHRGKWRDRQIISEEWIRMALTPTPAQKNVGFMNYFLNANGSFTHLGAGTNAIHVNPATNLVVVVRWIERAALEEFLSKVVGAVETGNR